MLTAQDETNQSTKLPLGKRTENKINSHKKFNTVILYLGMYPFTFLGFSLLLNMVAKLSMLLSLSIGLLLTAVFRLVPQRKGKIDNFLIFAGTLSPIMLWPQFFPGSTVQLIFLFAIIFNVYYAVVMTPEGEKNIETEGNQIKEGSAPEEITGEVKVSIPQKKVGFFGKLKAIVIILILLVIPLLYEAYVYSKDMWEDYTKKPVRLSSTTTSTAVKADDFFFFSIPKPIDKIDIFDLPSYYYPESAVEHKGKVWLTGNGAIVEFDKKNNSIISYTNPKKANCRSLIYAKGYIFASCFIDNVNDAFGYEMDMLKTDLFTGHSAIYKINPDTHRVEYIFTNKDGLKNQYNYKLYEDGDYIWVATFNGIGRINIKTNKVNFYTTELGDFNSTKKHYGISTMLIDKDYVWAWINANNDSSGGISLFNKTTEKWQSFGINELKDNQKDRFDLEFAKNGFAAKLIPGGLQIAFRDGQIGDNDRLVEKTYDYNSGKWTKINGDKIATGPESVNTSEYLVKNYPHNDIKIIDDFELTQIKLQSGQEIKIDGRNNLVISPLINGKRYILTNLTIDQIDNSSPFSKIMLKFGKSLRTSYYVQSPNDIEVSFYIEQNSLMAFAYSLNPGMGDTYQEAWLVDLKNSEVLKTYKKEDGLPAIGINEYTSLPGYFPMEKTGEELVIKKDNKEVLYINLKDYKLRTP